MFNLERLERSGSKKGPVKCRRPLRERIVEYFDMKVVVGRTAGG